MIRIALLILVALFPVSETALAFLKRSREQSATSEDRGSLGLLWLSVAVGVGLALAAQRFSAFHLPGPPETARLIALGLLLGGFLVRWAAILTLGRLFTVDIAIHEHHAVHQSGLYRYVRHPSYTGLLLTFLGLGVFFANWLSLLALLLPTGLALVNRVVKEERALLRSLGDDYAAYCRRTRRFIPGLF
ncbi:MAG TPA: isoprenylcysteine carboxylmethyltransferase family protein [Holophagaceae bacterium]|nr:isoprenylcysteine carboxylmethyltransferase family protein [Holophagaceae bacterium]